MNKLIGLRSETPTYDRSVFEGIWNLCGHGAHAEPFAESGLRVEDRGVCAEAVDLQGLDWMPAIDAEVLGSATPLVADGWGCFAFEIFGDWEIGPDEDLRRSAKGHGTEVREAVREAYRAQRKAQQVVGPLDEALQSRVEEPDEAIDTAAAPLTGPGWHLISGARCSR